MHESYILRAARPDDACVIADHRARMFVDMKLVSKEESPALLAATVPWIATLLLRDQYRGWFFEKDRQVVAGGGLHLSEHGPIPGSIRVGLSAHIANVYTLPAHRRRGLGRALIEEMLSWSHWNGVDAVTLDASADGRKLYESLGFIDTSIMRRAANLRESHRINPNGQQYAMSARQ